MNFSRRIPLLFCKRNYYKPARYGSFYQTPLPVNTVIKFVPQQQAWIVERFGKFHRILEPGLTFLVPFVDQISYVQSLKEQAVEIPSQSAITQGTFTGKLHASF